MLSLELARKLNATVITAEEFTTANWQVHATKNFGVLIRRKTRQEKRCYGF
jgi:hypothetical protein